VFQHRPGLSAVSRHADAPYVRYVRRIYNLSREACIWTIALFSRDVNRGMTREIHSGMGRVAWGALERYAREIA
jgi:hypothetical protein